MRKLRLAAAVSLALATPGVFALGLGDIEMRSALNQPMNAEIRLTSVKPGELDGMIVKLASADAFVRAGIERSQALTALSFAVDQSGGQPVIRITSSQPVVEPFLNFLLEVDWPQGRMVREYTVLLDPPVFMTPSASGSTALGDSPALGNRNDGALIAPAPIERDSSGSNAAVADSFEVELVGVDTPSQGGDQGDVVSLDEVGNDDVALLPAADVAPIQRAEQGDIVSLTDLSVPNTAADTARAAAEFDFQVESVGGTAEVGDDVVVGGPADRTVAASEQSGTDASARIADEGEIVSLDALDTGTQDAAGTSGGTRNVAQGDTLYEIAESEAGQGISVEQMMLALLAANKASFIDGNINLVRAGAILRVPEASEARALTQAQAVAEVGKQARLWQEYRDGLRATGGTRVATADTSSDAPADIEPGADGGLSADARAILEEARQEILDRESLRIVGDDVSSASSAQAGDAREGNDTAQLSDIERRLTLAREELSSTRLESDDLSDQAGELRNTTENFEALIALRQNDIAALEARLAEARDGGESVAEAGQDTSETAALAGDTVTAAADAVADAGQDAADAADTVADAGRNALTDAGQALDSVELVDSELSDGALDAVDDAATAIDAGTDAVADAVAVAQTVDRPWYQSLMQDPARLAIAGVGGVALLGVLGTLLWRRRRSDDDALLGDDDVEFLDGDAVDTFSAGRVGGRAGAAGNAAGAALDDAMEASDDAIEDTLAFGSDASAAVAIEAGSGADGDSEQLDKDDTISEVDVYLAYGLHGQAEELLTRAIDRDPNNPVYARKLLDTYHAQGNGEAFEAAAQDWHARFGGPENPEWPAIAALGHALRPQSPLFAGAADLVDKVGSESFGADRFEDDDFADLGSTDAGTGSVNRDFDGADSAPLEFGGDDESALMDQSLDPAFAFDESDLEATGDFSHIADEVAGERDDSVVDFPAFDETAAPAAVDIGAAPRAGTADAMDAVDAPELGADFTKDKAANEKLDDRGASQAAAGAAASASLADDLTLDLDQLSGELELDGTELLDDNFTEGPGLMDTDMANVEALEIPDLTADNDLLSGSEDADEVDTMMDLAKAYIDMGDKDSASSTLDEIVKSGTPEQVTEAETLLRKIS